MPKKTGTMNDIKNESEFEKKLADLINTYNMEAQSGTPSHILADYLIRCLRAFDFSVMSREGWYGRKPEKECIIQEKK